MTPHSGPLTFTQLCGTLPIKGGRGRETDRQTGRQTENTRDRGRATSHGTLQSGEAPGLPIRDKRPRPGPAEMSTQGSTHDSLQSPTQMALLL